MVLHSVFIQPNMAVKGTRRPSALFKPNGLFKFIGLVQRRQPARPLLLYMDSSFLQAFSV
jgi:hypothetical protein